MNPFLKILDEEEEQGLYRETIDEIDERMRWLEENRDLFTEDTMWQVKEKAARKRERLQG